MKTRDPKEKVDRISTEMSLSLIPNTNTLICLPTNFVDLQGNNPRPQDVIGINNIVFFNNEITPSNWFFAIQNIQESVQEFFSKNPKWKWIVIQSQESVDDILNKKQAQKQEEKLEQDQRRENYKIDLDPLALDARCIKAKYYSLEEYEKDNDTGYFPNNIKDNFQNGDEIWYYSECHLDYLGTLAVAFVLVRKDKVICSPLIGLLEGYCVTNKQMSEEAHRRGLR